MQNSFKAYPQTPDNPPIHTHALICVTFLNFMYIHSTQLPFRNVFHSFNMRAAHTLHLAVISANTRRQIIAWGFQQVGEGERLT